MTKPRVFVNAVIIVTLLIAQVGSAYASFAMPSHCNMHKVQMTSDDMNMEVKGSDDIHAALVNEALHSVDPMLEPSSNSSVTDNMSADCCDMTSKSKIENDSDSACCEGQCECSSVASSLVVFAPSAVFHSTHVTSTSPFAYSGNLLSTPLKKAQRPPIF